MVADSLNKQQLKDLVKENFKLKNTKPKIIEKIVFKIKEVEKPTDQVNIENDSIYIEDYYPDKENFLIKYINKTSITNQKGISKFNFNPFEITGVISQREDGIYQFDLKVPDYVKIGKIDIQAIPIEEVKVDNFGYLFGVGYGQNIETKENFININSYIRYKKFYVGLEATTQGNLLGGIKVEF